MSTLLVPRRLMLTWALLLVGLAAESADLSIIAPPGNPVTGEVQVEAALEEGTAAAELLLDGDRVCSLSHQAPGCTIDLGKEAHIHRLELVKRASSGEIKGRVVRWINRPGHEAMLEIGRQPSGHGRPCSALVRWVHPEDREPASIKVTVDGNPLRVDEETWSVRFPCQVPGRTQVLAASAVFSDGIRAEAVSVAGDETALSPLVLELSSSEELSCDDDAFELPGVELVEAGGFEVVFVLDPGADFQTLLASGWSAEHGLNDEGNRGSGATEARPSSSWISCEASLGDAEWLWFVVPDARLARANGFSRGREGWLRLLFGVAGLELEQPLRIADAVAAAGMVAGAGPRRRAVVLLLGDGSTADASRLTPAMALSYLKEVGVPLVVLRTGAPRSDGWPAGLPNRDMEAMAHNLSRIVDMLDRQCVAWFQGDTETAFEAPEWPTKVRRAGSSPGEEIVVDTMPRVAEAAEEQIDDRPESPFGHSMDVTAVSLLVSASGGDSEPVTDLALDDLEVFEDGSRVTLIGLQPIGLGRATVEEAAAAEAKTELLPRPDDEVELPISIYLEKRLGDSMSVKPMLEQLIEEAQLLVDVGPVEIVVAGERVTTSLRATRDVAELEGGLRQVLDELGGRSQVEQIRRSFVRDIRNMPKRIAREQARTLQANPEGGAVAENPDDEGMGFKVPFGDRSHIKMAARSAASQEEAVVRSCLERLQRWALRFTGAQPKLLFMVGAAFDEDPLLFYLPFVEKEEPHNVAELRAELEERRQGNRVVQLADELAGAGWRIIALAGHSTAGFAAAAEHNEGTRLQSFLSASPEAARSPDAGWFLLDPVASQRRLVASSGGDVVVGADELRTQLDRMRGWYRLTYQLDRPADGTLHAIEVRTRRSGLTIRRPQVIASETSEAQAQVRLLHALDGSAARGGDLLVRLQLGDVANLGARLASEIVASVDLEPVKPVIERLAEVRIRISVAVTTQQTEPFVLHRVERLYGSGSGSLWNYTVPLEWPPGGGRLGLIAEELSTGTWGWAVLDLPR